MAEKESRDYAFQDGTILSLWGGFINDSIQSCSGWAASSAAERSSRLEP